MKTQQFENITRGYGMKGERSKESLKGKVKTWFNEKGFGFITSDGKDYFTHVTKLEDGVDKLEVDQEVEFYTVETPKGIQAIDVSINVH